MAQLFYEDWESGSDGWSLVAVAPDVCEVTAVAPLAGSYSLRVVSTAAYPYALYSLGAAIGELWIRLTLQVKSHTSSNGQVEHVFWLYNGCYLYIWNAAGVMKVTLRYVNNAGGWSHSAQFTMGTTARQIDIHLKKKTGPADGIAELWIDGVQQVNITDSALNSDLQTFRCESGHATMAALQMYFDDVVLGESQADLELGNPGAARRRRLLRGG